MWKKISSKILFKHPRISIVEDDVKLTNGKKIKYIKYEGRRDCATIICQREDDKIILLKEYSYPMNKEMYQFPGGAIEKGEKSEQGAQRELTEEVSYKANTLRLLGSFIMNNRKSKAKMYVYLASDLETAFLRGDNTEEIKKGWFTENEIDGMIKSGDIINSPTLSSWSIYKAKKK